MIKIAIHWPGYPQLDNVRPISKSEFAPKPFVSDVTVCIGGVHYEARMIDENTVELKDGRVINDLWRFR